jgi:hypothetical protein
MTCLEKGHSPSSASLGRLPGGEKEDGISKEERDPIGCVLGASEAQ